MKLSYISIANIIIDDVLLSTGQMYLGNLGGSGSHALSGARVWNDNLGLLAHVGYDFRPDHRAQLRQLNIDLSGLIEIHANTARAWQIFHPDETRIEVFRDPATITSKQTPEFNNMQEDFLSALGYHIYWDKGLPELKQQIDWLRAQNQRAHFVWEPAERHIHDQTKDFQLVLPKVNLFSPNELEGRHITGEGDVSKMIDIILDWGAPLVAIRRGAMGSMIGNQRGEKWNVPACAEVLLDVTGAGNAYCGGFLVGLGEGKDIPEAAAMAAVSASFALEQYGLPSFDANLVEKRQNRLEWTLSKIQKLEQQPLRRTVRGSLSHRKNPPPNIEISSIDGAWLILEKIANTLAPGQTLAYTRAPVLREILSQWAKPGFTFDSNYQNTGNSVLYWGPIFPKNLFFSHADQISFLVGPSLDKHNYRLIPNCSFLSQIEIAGAGLRYDPQAGIMDRVARGIIKPEDIDGRPVPYFSVKEGSLLPGDRVVYDFPLQREAGDFIRGSLDNAYGVTACLLAAIEFSNTAPDTDIGFVFSDDEEGPPLYPVSFSRGARRLMRQIECPDLCFIVDGHPNDHYGVGSGALYAETSGQCAAGITPPHIYQKLQFLADQMRSQGIILNENRGKVSRGDEIALIEFTPNTAMLGYPSTNRHFDEAPPRGSLQDLLHLANAVYWIASNIDKFRK